MTQSQKVTFILSAVILLVWCGSVGWCQVIPDSSMSSQSGSPPGEQWSGQSGQFPDSSTTPGTGYDPYSGDGGSAATTGGTTDTGGDASAVRGAGTSTGSGLSGGLGGSALDGLIAGSPRIKAKELGLDIGIILTGKLSQEIGDVVQLSLDYSWTRFEGSKTYTGPTILYWPSLVPYLTTGDGVNSAFNVSLLTAIVDLDVVPLVSQGTRSVELGPRFLFLDYWSSLNIGNSTTGKNNRGESRYHIPAFGGFFNYVRDSPQTAWYFLYGGMPRPIIPSLRLAGCFGTIDDVQYTQAEVFARAEIPGGWLRTSILGFDLWISSIYAELGYIYRGLTQDTETLSDFTTGIGVQQRAEHVRGDADFDLHSVVVRTGIVF